ncbi:MAG TPA: ThiF family adenylyltransferase [Anaerolineae bacterium]|nr:ThiF family adenylyltransferase [Anaerolineae bacterium]
MPEDFPQDLIVITDPNEDRYNAFRLISWWEHDVLENARVMVLGAGATGNEVLKNLALMGVGHILISDFDTIQRANLARSVLFREQDEGLRKADVATKAVKELNPDVKVQPFHGDIIYELGLGVYRRMDVVIGCVDSRRARLAVNQSCWKVAKPWVDGGLDALNGQARVYWPGRGACYECTLFEQDYVLMEQRNSCQQLAIKAFMEGRIPTTPTSASIIGAVQAQEAMKIVHGIDVKAGKVFMYDGLLYDAGWYTLSERENCPSHWHYEPIVELPNVSHRTTLSDFMRLIHQQTNPEAVVELNFDFVTAWECGICGQSESVMKPKHKLSYEDSLCCGEERLAITTFRLTGDEAFAQYELGQIGIPPLEVLRIDIGDGQYAYFELSGDDDFVKF